MPKDAAPNEKPHKQDFEYHGRTPVTKPSESDVKFEPATFISQSGGGSGGPSDGGDVMFAPYHNYASTIVVETRKRGGEDGGEGGDGSGDVAVKRRVMSEGGLTTNSVVVPRHHSVGTVGGTNGQNGQNGQNGLTNGSLGTAQFMVNGSGSVQGQQEGQQEGQHSQLCCLDSFSSSSGFRHRHRSRHRHRFSLRFRHNPSSLRNFS